MSREDVAWSTLRQLDGIDDKVLTHPAFSRLLDILEEGELPECVGRNGRVDVFVATDRRIIHLKRSFWGNAIKVVDYPYGDIRSINADMGFAELGCTILTNGRSKVLPMQKSRREQFAAIVRSHVLQATEAGTPVPPRPPQPPAAKTGGVWWKWALGGASLVMVLVIALVVFAPNDGDIAAVAEPTATATAGPTSTPWPTYTPRPTATARPTPTLLPDGPLAPTPTLVPRPTPRPTARPTATLVPRTPAPIIIGISRQQAYDRFEALNIGLLPLDRHTDEWYSTAIRGAGIVIDIFGTRTRVEAIESIFRVPEGAAKMDTVVGAMLEIALGDDWGGGYQWVLRSIEEDLSEANVKAQTRMNGVYLTLYFISSIDSVMFTVDTERQ